MEGIEHWIRMAVNTVNRERDAIYLDTNAWSLLARGRAQVDPLARWAERNNCVLWLARMQLAELSVRSDIIHGLANVLEKVGVIILDRGQHEFSGEPWYQVDVDLRQYVRLTTPELKLAFVSEFQALTSTRSQLMSDADAFGAALNETLARIPSDTPRDWSSFPSRVRSHIRSRCEANGHAVNETALDDPACYPGLRLSFAVLFLRYFLNRQTWKRSDYLDYLHAADMAYAKAVVTERNLAECLRQAMRRRDLQGPGIVEVTPWLQAPNAM